MEELDLYYKVVETIEEIGHEHYNGKYVVDVSRLAEDIVKLFAIPDVSVRCDCNDVNKYKCNEDPRCKRIPIKNKIEICPYPAKYCSDCCFFDKNAR